MATCVHPQTYFVAFVSRIYSSFLSIFNSTSFLNRYNWLNEDYELLFRQIAFVRFVPVPLFFATYFSFLPVFFFITLIGCREAGNFHACSNFCLMPLSFISSRLFPFTYFFHCLPHPTHLQTHWSVVGQGLRIIVHSQIYFVTLFRATSFVSCHLLLLLSTFFLLITSYFPSYYFQSLQLSEWSFRTIVHTFSYFVDTFICVLPQ